MTSVIAKAVFAAVTDVLSEASVELVESAPGVRGADDLRRDATPIAIRDDLEVNVASLRDLVRMAEASPEVRARTPALSVALERSHLS